MPSGKGTYWANTMLDEVLGGTGYTPVATVYLGLYTVAPTAAAGDGTEVTGGSYARKAVTNNSTNFPAAAAGVKSNGVAQAFATATADWGTVVSATIMDAVSAGNKLYFGSLTASKNVLNGDTAQFNIGALQITET